jgi:signal transduction histidine kinase
LNTKKDFKENINKQIIKIKDTIPAPKSIIEKFTDHNDLFQSLAIETKKKAILLRLKTKEITSSYSEYIRNQHSTLSKGIQTVPNTKINKKDMTNFYTVIIFYAMSTFLFNISLFLKLEKRVSFSLSRLTKKLKYKKSTNRVFIDYSKFSLTVNELLKKIKEYEHSTIFFKKKAEKELENKTRLLAELSHELKTPLNGIMGYAQILLMNENSLSTTQIKCINKIMESGKYLNDIIEDVLLMAKTNTDHLSFECSEVNVKEVIEYIIEMLHDLAIEKNIKIKNEFPPDKQFFAYGNKKRVKQIFYNLISNGLKYNRMNGELVISGDLEDDYLVIKIKDTGIGIPDFELENIFKPFYRVGLTEIEGTGIGLSLVKEFIEAMNGEILVNSKENEGSEFIIKFIKFNTDGLPSKTF